MQTRRTGRLVRGADRAAHPLRRGGCQGVRLQPTVLVLRLLVLVLVPVLLLLLLLLLLLVLLLVVLLLLLLLLLVVLLLLLLLVLLCRQLELLSELGCVRRRRVVLRLPLATAVAPVGEPGARAWCVRWGLTRYGEEPPDMWITRRRHVRCFGARVCSADRSAPRSSGYYRKCRTVHT